MNFTYPTNMGSFPQQSFYTPTMSKHSQWLLQQPKDSGYASDDYDLFEKAFQTQLCPTDTSHMDQTCISTFSDSSCSDASRGSPFEYADSLQPSYDNNHNDQWTSFQRLNRGAKKLSIDAGISSMTGYCDIDSLMTAAYYDTCTTQTKRFQSFSAQRSPHHSGHASIDLSISPLAQRSDPLPHIGIIEEPIDTPDLSATTEVPALDVSSKGRPRGRVPHTAVEQRYRQNLNDQFCRLREAVPEIQTSQPARSGQPPKASKAEVLMAAAEYIKQLEEENDQLRENMSQALESRRKRTKTG